MYRCHKELANTGGLCEIFDMACGHGLLGVLLAYRFPDVKVVCVDLEPRMCWEHYLEAWASEGLPASGHAVPLDNLHFFQGDLASVTISARTGVVSVHACNEANLIILRKCRESKAPYAVMPCCIPQGIYSSMDCSHLADELRYTALVGMMASQFSVHPS